MKGSANVAAMSPRRMARYAKLCGWTLAHAHARSGDSIAISGYLGSSDVFDQALTEFAVRYAEQNQHHYEASPTLSPRDASEQKTTRPQSGCLRHEIRYDEHTAWAPPATTRRMTASTRGMSRYSGPPTPREEGPKFVFYSPPGLLGQRNG
jgi:hypothetical protein